MFGYLYYLMPAEGNYQNARPEAPRRREVGRYYCEAAPNEPFAGAEQLAGGPGFSGPLLELRQQRRREARLYPHRDLARPVARSARVRDLRGRPGRPVGRAQFQ